jgi:hypothetical protein
VCGGRRERGLCLGGQIPVVLWALPHCVGPGSPPVNVEASSAQVRPSQHPRRVPRPSGLRAFRPTRNRPQLGERLQRVLLEAVDELPVAVGMAEVGSGCELPGHGKHLAHQTGVPVLLRLDQQSFEQLQRCSLLALVEVRPRLGERSLDLVALHLPSAVRRLRGPSAVTSIVARNATKLHPRDPAFMRCRSRGKSRKVDDSHRRVFRKVRERRAASCLLWWST